MIYLAINTSTFKNYIGQTSKTLDVRRLQHEKNARGGRKSRFYSALRKYGVSCFQWWVLISDSGDRASTDAYERFLISLFSANDPRYGYNLTAGGDGMSNPSEETRRRMIESHKGQTHNRGRKFTGEIREKMIARLHESTRNLGHHHSISTKAKMRAAKLGKPQCPEHTEKIRTTMLARSSKLTN